jgi:hypothetical protein
MYQKTGRDNLRMIAMDNANIIDFIAYRKHYETRLIREDSLSEDLVTAIQLLIERLRESSPLSA